MPDRRHIRVILRKSLFCRIIFLHITAHGCSVETNRKCIKRGFSARGKGMKIIRIRMR